MDVSTSKSETGSNYTFDENILEFQHSFGYDSKRLSNLCLISPDVLVFASGNLINFFQINSKEIKTQKSVNGGGIGYITKNPNPTYNFLTVAENSPNAAIFIYKFPEMEIVSKCEQSDTNEYSCIDYNPDGSLMVSQTGAPNFFITIWNWQSGSIILNTKSTKNVVFRVMFSLYDPHQLTTSGQGHIQFWKISETFSGLKLKSQIGRFGKTKISDISAIHAIPNGQVLSGSDWGNILVWEEGLIKFEVCRKNRATCHASAITQIEMENGDVMTVGMDGYVRIWFWDTVLQADPPDTDLFVQIEPIYEFRIGDEEVCCCLMTLARINPQENWWYAQDGNGGIWKCDLNLVNNPPPPERLFRCHSGRVIGIGVCPYESIIGTLGQDGRLHFYDYETHGLKLWKRFSSEGRCLIWLDTDIDPSGRILVLGFADGVIRVVVIDFEATDASSQVNLIQAIKPHRNDVTRMSINENKTILISGSADHTVFVFEIVKKLPNVTLQPVGFIPTPSTVTAFNWKPHSLATALVGCQHGEILEFVAYDKDVKYDASKTYRLDQIRVKNLKFKSVKSKIRRDKKLTQIKERKAAKRLMKSLKLKELRKENPDVRIDETAFLEDSDSDEEIEPLFIPKTGNPILWIKYTSANTIWFAAGEFDSGYVYEYAFDSEDALHCIELEKEDIEVNCYLIMNDFLIFGMSNGSLRISKIHEDFRNLSNYWEIYMHDNMNGVINQIISSLDSKFIFTVGNDSNIFSFKNNIPGVSFKQTTKTSPFTSMESFSVVEDILDPESLSLEEQKIKHNLDVVNQIANLNKEKVKKVIAEYKVEFEEIVRRNNKLIKSMQVDMKTIDLNERITADIQKHLDQEMELVERKMAYDVEKCKILTKKVKDFYISPLEELPIELQGIKTQSTVKSFRVLKIRDEVTQQWNPYERNVEKGERDIKSYEAKKSIVPVTEEDDIMTFLNDFECKTSDLKFELQMKRLWKKYCSRKMDESYKRKEWTTMTALMPDLEQNAPEDVEQLKEAESQIGDYKLKRDAAYVETIENRTTTADKFKELLGVRKQIDFLRRDYNRRLFELRDEKLKLVVYTKTKLVELQNIHSCLPPKLRKNISHIPEMVDDKEFPQKIFDELEHFNSTYTASTSETIQLKKDVDLPTILSNILSQLNQSSGEDETPWASELTKVRQIELEFIQNQIIKDIDEQINKFDENLNELKRKRLQIETDVKYLEIHLISLNQELCIVKDFERIENHLIDQVENGERLYTDALNEIEELNQEIVAHTKKIKNNTESIATLTQEFNGRVANNKYTKFLSKIFKKKQPVEKKIGVDDEDDEDSSETSESSSDEDETSLNSKTDIGALYFDETVCPKDCDRNLYDLTLKLRSQRQNLEVINRSSQLEIENIKNALTALGRKSVELEKQLAIQKRELIASMKEKQDMLNDVDHLVILRMHQMQYFQNKEELFAVDKSLVFNISVFNKLFARVGELELETIASKRKHRVNIIHLARMNTDCKYMEELICDLNRDFRQAMIKKFGMTVNLDELQETILNRFVFTLRSNFEDVKKEYAKKAQELKAIHFAKQAELENQIIQVIEKLNILTVLEEDRNFIDSLLLSQKKKENSRRRRPPMNIQQDVAKLQEISKQQLQTIANLEKEIYTLRLKAKPFGGMNNENMLADRIKADIDGCCTSNTKSSSSTNQMNNKTVIHQLVTQFFFGKSSTDMASKEKDIERISKHLLESIQSLDFDEMEQSITALVEDFQKCLPKNWYDKFTATQIALFIQDVFRKINLFDEDNDFEPEELLYGIVQDIKDSISPTTVNYGQTFYLELFKNLLHNLRIEDLLNNDMMSLLVSILLDYVGTINISTENESKILTSLMDSLTTASNDNIDVGMLKHLTDYVFTSMRNKRK